MADKISDVMTIDPITMPQNPTVQEAAQAMRDSDVGDVIILDDSEQLRGIVTDRDIAIRMASEGKDPTQTDLGDICSRQIQSLSPDDEVADAIRLMRSQAIRRLPVLKEGRPVSIVSLGDLATSVDPDSPLADISAAPPNR